MAILLFWKEGQGGAVCLSERLEYVVEIEMGRLRRRGCGGAGNVA